MLYISSYIEIDIIIINVAILFLHHDSHWLECRKPSEGLVGINGCIYSLDNRLEPRSHAACGFLSGAFRAVKVFGSAPPPS